MTTTIVRPVSDTFTLNLKLSGAATATGCIQEASPDNDSTYVWHDDGGGTKRGWGLMGSPGLTTETGITVDLWVRGRSETGGTAGRLGVGCAAASEHTTWQLSNTTYQDFEDANVPEPGDGTWSVAEANAMAWDVSTSPNDGSSPSVEIIRCTQLWFEVNYTVASGKAAPFPGQYMNERRLMAMGY